MIKNRLLQRQIDKVQFNAEALPSDLGQWKQFLQTVEKTYSELDQQRVFNENLIDVSTQEMERLYKALETKTKNEIEKQEEKLSQVIEAVPSLVGWVDRNGIILGLNDQLAQILGTKKEFATGHSFGDFGFKNISQFIESSFSGDAIEVSMNLSFQNNGENFYYKLVFKRFYEDQMMALVGIDLTADLKKEKELEIARNKSITSSRMAVLGEMAAGIAHEINNPLTIINTISTLIARNLKANRYDEIPEKLEKIQKTVRRITKIISGLRTFARDGEHDPFVKTQLLEIINDTLERIPEAIKEKIFQPFFTTKEVGVGTGLGLSISVGIIQSHNGSFQIDSNCENTRFVIMLPKSQTKRIIAS